MITPDQIRAARALKNWSQTELAERTELAVPTIANIELGKQTPSQATLSKIRETFEHNDITFIDVTGVEKNEKEVKVFRGNDALYDFYEDIWNTLSDGHNEVLVGNVNERDFVRNLDKKLLEDHLRTVKKLRQTKTISYKILLKEGDYFFAGNYPSEHGEYRWTPKDEFQSIPFYVFGDKMAIILWLDETIIFLINSREATSIYREKFQQMWEKSIKPDKTYTLDELDLDDEVREKMNWKIEQS